MKTRTRALIAWLGVALLLLTAIGSAAAAPVAGAVYTTVNEAADGKGHCKNGNPGVNCNIYDGKQYVWLNGGPASNGLRPDGQYFFAVLAPGGQPDPNDGGAKNLSDDYDAYTNRTFTVANGEVSAYSGTHDLDSGAKGGQAIDRQPPFIRLFPYADTTNPGGVYIMAVCFIGVDGTQYPVEPRSCKYDAFKVQKGQVNVQAFLSGKKYRDDNKNGQLDGEIGLANWEIRISDGSNTWSRWTDANGDWSYATPLHTPATGTSTYTITEVQQANWKQTGNTVDQSIASVGSAVSLVNKVYTVTIPNDDPAVVSGLNFGNIPQGQVAGKKYYDGNQNGQLDNEAGIQGWKISQGGNAVDTIWTDAAGNFAVTLDPGTYTFTEVQATNGWFQTGNTLDQSATSGGATVSLASKSYTVVIPVAQPSNVAGLYFGNACQLTPGGLTIGFWSNKNGQALETADDFAALTALHLRDANGGDRDFTAALDQNKADYNVWLLDANANNMAYMLSAQLSATTLNVRHGITNPNVLVDGTRTVSDLLAYADSLLAANGNTVADSADRTEQGRVKDILDRINNGRSFVQPAADACPAPTFP